MKSQLATFTEKGKIPVLDFLSAALESAEYERALARAIVSVEKRFMLYILIDSFTFRGSQIYSRSLSLSSPENGRVSCRSVL